jgi:capsular polysaccharide transport system permease protein
MNDAETKEPGEAAREPASARDPAARPKARPGAKKGEVLSHPALAGARLAAPARPKRRHRLTLVGFLLAVVLPGAASVAYLHGVAADQYASRLAFSVRGPSDAPSVDLLGAVTAGLGGSSSAADAQIVYEFIRSQQMVEAAMARLPLVEIFNRPENDVVFRLGEDRSIEDIVAYWRWMIDVAVDPGTGIVHVEARAFDPDSAHAIVEVVLEESTRVVNEISTKARLDAVAVAQEVLTQSENRLREVRRSLRAFRDVEQELDPTENARASLGLVSALEADLARTEVELSSEIALVGRNSPRLAVLRQRIDSLRERIDAERMRIGAGGRAGATAPDGRAFADLVAEYEDLVVDRQFAENAYVASLASYEQAQVEARRQMRYLSPHVRPTRSVEPEYPQRLLLSAGVTAGLLVAWAVTLLIVYNVRDRR